MNLQSRLRTGTLLSIVVTAGVYYFWNNGSTSWHAAIIAALTFAMTILLDVVLVLAKMCDDLQETIDRIQAHRETL